MARKTTSRMELRRQAEAAEAGGTPAATATTTGTRKKAAATGAKPKRTKEKPVARKRMIWVVYNGSMKEEGRFAYDQRAAAEEKIEQLRQKSKKLYFIQPVKEVIGDPGATIGLAAAAAAAALKAIEPPEEVEIPEEVAAEVEAEAEAEEEEEEEDDSDE
jgi:selenocysteine lyase/cysteine desulfurase